LTRMSLIARAHTPASSAPLVGLKPTDVRQMSKDSSDDGFFKKLNPFKRRQAKEEQSEREKMLDELMKKEEELLQAAEAEMAHNRLQRKRNKSGLHYSDRQMLKGAPPNVGLYDMQWTERHTTKQFKATMLGKFGRSGTGVDPSVAWPTKAEIESQQEYERVFYEGTDLRERIALHNQTEQYRKQKMIEYEQEIDANLAQMDREVKAWKARVIKREAEAAREKAMKDAIFSELRQEFGYDINPHDPMFRAKIEEKEKALAKKTKLEKRARREEETNRLREEETKAKLEAAAKLKAAVAASSGNE